MALKGGSVLIPENTDSAKAIINGKSLQLDEIKVIYESKTVTAWKKQKYYYITFQGNGGTGSMDQQTIGVGIATKLAANAYTRLGYLFGGWAKSAAGAKAYSDQQEVTDIAAAGATLALYALWTAITYYIKYNGNGGSGSMSNSTHRYDTAKALTANAYNRIGYSFQGWATSATGAVAYSNGQSVKNLSSVHGSTINLYAVWKDLGYYAVKDGVLQSSAANAAAWAGGYNNGYGNLLDNNDGVTAFYGGQGHTSGDGQSWGADTYALPTNGCHYLSVVGYINNWTDGGGATLTVWGDSTELKNAYVYGSTNRLYAYTFDVSGYSTVRVRIERTVDGNANFWANVGLREVRLYN